MLTFLDNVPRLSNGTIHGIFPCPMLSNSVISYVIPLLDLHEVPNNIVQLSTMDRVVGGMTG